MRIAYEPGRTVGGVLAFIGALSALAIYYEILTPEAAALWSTLAMIVIPPVQAEITRRYTMAMAKIEDAAIVDPSIHPEVITRKAVQGRRRRKASAGGPASPSGSHAPPL